MTGNYDLELLLERALAEPSVAEQALASFASALAGYTESQVSALVMGAKIWFRLNGVNVPWRSLPGRIAPPALIASDQQGVERLILLALIGSGLRLAELLRLRIGNVGSLDSEGRIIPDIQADPLGVEYTPRRGKPRPYLTFSDLPGAAGITNLPGTTHNTSNSYRAYRTGCAADRPARWLTGESCQRSACQEAQPVIDSHVQRCQRRIMPCYRRFLPRVGPTRFTLRRTRRSEYRAVHLVLSLQRRYGVYLRSGGMKGGTYESSSFAPV